MIMGQYINLEDTKIKNLIFFFAILYKRGGANAHPLTQAGPPWPDFL